MLRITILPLLLLCVGCASHPVVEVKPASFLEMKSPAHVERLGDASPLYVAKKAILTDADFARASINTGTDGTRSVTYTLSESAADRFAAYTAAHLNEPLAIYLDGEFLIAPVILAEMHSQIMISSGGEGLSEAQAARLVSCVRKD